MTDTPKTSETRDNQQPPKLTIDWDVYGQYLEDSDLSEDQKIEMIETLWSIVVSFVDLGFNVAPQTDDETDLSGLATKTQNENQHKPEGVRHGPQ